MLQSRPTAIGGARIHQHLHYNYLPAYVDTVGAQKIAVPLERNLLAEAWMSEEAGNNERAYEKYKLALQDQTTDESRRKCIKAMIRTQDHSSRRYDDIQSFIDADRETSTASYAAVLDYLMCTLPMKAGDVRGSVALFEEKARLWSGAPMGEEMNCRLAVLYGRNLGDADTGRRYADAVASVNPGCRFLENAYDACEVEYDPTAFEDRSINYIYTEKPAAHENPLADEAIEPSVAISPNPANPATTISYTIAKSARVSLDIYSITGQKVATLVDRTMPAGRHSVVFDGSNLASGVYFYRLEIPGFAKTGKMLMVK